MMSNKDHDHDHDHDENEIGANNSTEAANQPLTNSSQPLPSVIDKKKVHHVTVCIVPPPEAQDVWETIGTMRRQLKDPGYYRWPPHCNLLYPFLDLPICQSSEADPDLQDIVNKLRNATSTVEPFTIRLNQLGTFGGRRRGVLWLAPESFRQNHHTMKDTSGNKQEQEAATAAAAAEKEIINQDPLHELYDALIHTFPTCQDQTKGGSFTPHMTLSHFSSLDDAWKAKTMIENDYGNMLPSLQFELDYIYLLLRRGDGGQFFRVGDIGLGHSGEVLLHDTENAIPFPQMPTKEDKWVHVERMRLKERRNNGRSNRGGRSRQSRNRRRLPRVVDTPEIIAEKRAARKAKREQLEQEQNYHL